VMEDLIPADELKAWHVEQARLNAAPPPPWPLSDADINDIGRRWAAYDADRENGWAEPLVTDWWRQNEHGKELAEALERLRAVERRVEKARLPCGPEHCDHGFE
jgi:hypothetical protein